MSPWKGEEPRVYDLTCDDTVCPPDSFCLSDYDSGGSRCHCNLGRAGDTCSEGERIVVLQKTKQDKLMSKPFKANSAMIEKSIVDDAAMGRLQLLLLF